jgi:hypothetical protein
MPLSSPMDRDRSCQATASPAETLVDDANSILYLLLDCHGFDLAKATTEEKRKMLVVVSFDSICHSQCKKFKN